MLKLLKVMATTGGASGVTMLLGLLTNKIVAVVLGPAGVGLLSSYRLIQDVVTGLGIFGGAGAQVQALSSVEGEARSRRVVACVWLTMTGMAIFTVVLLAGAPLIADHFFRSSSPDIVFALRCMAVTFCVSVIAIVASGFVNVSGAIGRLSLAQVMAGAGGVVAAWPLATLAAGGSQLAYVGMILAPLAVTAGLTVFMSWRLGWLPHVAAAFRQKPLRADIRHFLSYFAAHLVSSLVNAISLLALRATLIETAGQGANGLFQASWILTQQNLVMLMSSFATYLLPTLSATHDVAERKRFLDDTLPLIIVLTVPMAGVGLLFMPLVLHLLYSAEFLPAIAPLRWMLLANLFSALIAVFVVLLLARNRPLISAATEVGWYLGFAGTGIAILTGVIDPAWIGMGSLEALGAAFFAAHTVRLVFLIVVCRLKASYTPSPDVWRIGGIGFALLLLAAWQGWSAQSVNWLTSIPSALLLCATPLLLLNRSRLARLRGMLRVRLNR